MLSDITFQLQLPGLTVDQITQCGIHHDQLMDGSPSAKTFVITGGTALWMVQSDGTGVGNSQQAFFFVSGWCGLAAVGTQRANQSLRHHARQTGREQERLHAHILQTCDRPHRCVGMQRGKDQVSGK